MQPLVVNARKRWRVHPPALGHGVDPTGHGVADQDIRDLAEEAGDQLARGPIGRRSAERDRARQAWGIPRISRARRAPSAPPTTGCQQPPARAVAPQPGHHLLPRHQGPNQAKGARPEGQRRADQDAGGEGVLVDAGAQQIDDQRDGQGQSGDGPRDKGDGPTAATSAMRPLEGIGRPLTEGPRGRAARRRRREWAGRATPPCTPSRGPRRRRRTDRVAVDRPAASLRVVRGAGRRGTRPTNASARSPARREVQSWILILCSTGSSDEAGRCHKACRDVQVHRLGRSTRRPEGFMEA